MMVSHLLKQKGCNSVSNGSALKGAQHFDLDVNVSVCAATIGRGIPGGTVNRPAKRPAKRTAAQHASSNVIFSVTHEGPSWNYERLQKEEHLNAVFFNYPQAQAALY